MMTRKDFERDVHGEAVRLSSGGIAVREIRTSVAHVHEIKNGVPVDSWQWRAMITPAIIPGKSYVELASVGKTPELCLEGLRHTVRNEMADSGDNQQQLASASEAA